ncbi:DUF3237 domain-containing protein [Bergeriella denitrificans]|uniref:UPF0311 protein NCTC10295_01368 n=1 Tax=Bergeriella denitrificans TaxID=494 RepID=A0A378UGT9_BERDE|nr:DUF3237 domain-containing protein [Bergeriella denitrificans]STZ76594.1 Protein of uncharacterised function (DUF3237) [Bergeriella denitrificans]
MKNKLYAFALSVFVAAFPVHASGLTAADIKEPTLEPAFMIDIQVAKPLVVGQDAQHGRRQLISITGGKVSGKLKGEVLPYGVDSQVIRPDGFTELTARYAIKLEDGKTVYIDNSGIRRINDPEAAKLVAQGQIVDPKHVYFATVSKFETYSPEYKWLEQSVFICYAVRLPDKVLLKFYEVK